MWQRLRLSQSESNEIDDFAEHAREWNKTKRKNIQMKWQLNSTYWHAKKGYRKFDTLTAINVFNLLHTHSHTQTHTQTHTQ